MLYCSQLCRTDYSNFGNILSVMSTGMDTQLQLLGDSVLKMILLICCPVSRIFHVATAPVGLGLLIIEASRLHSDTPQSVGLLWTSDQSDAETST